MANFWNFRVVGTPYFDLAPALKDVIMRKRITYLRLLFLLFLPTLSTGGSHSTTWAHLSHHHDQYQFTDHVVATFCHEFSTVIATPSIDAWDIEVKCGDRFYSTHATPDQLIVAATSNKRAILIKLHLAHKHWKLSWENSNQGHPAECDLIIDGNVVHTGNAGNAGTSGRTIHRRPPSHRCWSKTNAKKKSAPIDLTPTKTPSFSMQRHMSTEQTIQLIDYLHHAADALITYARLKEPKATHTHNRTHVQRNRHLLETNKHEDEHDVSSESLLQVVNSIDMASQMGVGIKMQTIYENIVNPITNAVAAQLPDIIFLLVKFPIAIQMRDSLTESMKDMMTAPTLGNLDPDGPGAPPVSLLEESNASPGPAESPEEGLGNTLGMQIADSVSVELSDALWKNLKTKLEDSISNSVTRQTVRSLNHILTGALSHTMSRMIMELASKSLTRSIAKETNRILIPSLTQSISEIVTHALTRNPKSDYYCNYCHNHLVYCDLCQTETKDSYELDWNIAYYSKYYGNYYSWYYSNSFVDAATDEYLRMGKREV
jgi:hypothetical protein